MLIVDFNILDFNSSCVRLSALYEDMSNSNYYCRYVITFVCDRKAKILTISLTLEQLTVCRGAHATLWQHSSDRSSQSQTQSHFHSIGMQTPFPCLWHLKSSLDAQSSEKSSQFLYPLHWLFTFSQMLTPFFLHKKRWSSEQLLHCSTDVCESSAQPPSPLQTKDLGIYLTDRQIGRRSRLENWHKIARQIHW